MQSRRGVFMVSRVSGSLGPNKKSQGSQPTACLDRSQLRKGRELARQVPEGKEESLSRKGTQEEKSLPTHCKHD